MVADIGKSGSIQEMGRSRDAVTSLQLQLPLLIAKRLYAGTSKLNDNQLAA